MLIIIFSLPELPQNSVFSSADVWNSISDFSISLIEWFSCAAADAVESAAWDEKRCAPNEKKN